MTASIERWIGPRTLAQALVVLAFAVTVRLNWPGHLEYDSIVQLLQGRTGVYSNWHPPVMAWLLGIGDRLVRGAGLFVVFDALLAYGALFCLVSIAPRPTWLAAPAVLGLAAMPQLVLYQAIVLKDVLFADATLAGFACIALAACVWERRAARTLSLAAAALLVSLAVLTRQNGLLILPFAFAAVGIIAVRRQPRGAIATALVFAAACAVIELGATAALNTRVTAKPSQSEIRVKAEIYDMIGMIKLDPGLKLPILDARAPTLEKLMRGRGLALYSPASFDPLAGWSELGFAGLAAQPAVAAQWRSLILTHPLTYLSVRARVFAWLTLSRHPNQCAVYAVGVDGPADKMAALGMAPRDDDRDDALDDYAGRFVGWGLFHPTFYVIGAACAAFMARRRSDVDLAMLALLGAAMLYAASYFVISIACEYRYLYVVDLAVLASGLHIAASWRGRADA